MLAIAKLAEETSKKKSQNDRKKENRNRKRKTKRMLNRFSEEKKRIFSAF